MLTLTVKEGTYVKIGDDIIVKYVKDAGSGQISMGIQAPMSYNILRESVIDRNLHTAEETAV